MVHAVSEGADGAALLGVLQADALVSRDDFRADERAAQLLGTLAQFFTILFYVVLRDRA